MKKKVIEIPNEYDFSEKINRWILSAKDEEDFMNIKELSRLSSKEIKQKVHARKTGDNNCLYKISQRHKVWELSLYYNDPERYFYDTYVLMRNLDHDIHDQFNCGQGYVQFRYPNKSKVYDMSLIHFTFNMIIWFPLFILEIPITKDLTFMNKVFNNKTYIEFINTKIIEPYKHMVTHNEMSRMLAKMYDMFIFMCERYGLDLGLSFSIYDFISKWSDPEIYDLNHTKIPKDMQISESENYLNTKLRRYMEIMQNDPEDNVLKPLIRAKQGVSDKQLREFAISGGFKPDLSGNTYPIKPRSNLITDGYRNPTDYVIDAVGGRKAGVLALQIDASGYLARSFSKSVMDLKLHPDPNYDCGSVNYYEKEIASKKDLEDMAGRWYLNEDNNHLVQLIDTDYDIIGKTLKFRSPTTCASKDGICATCYGHMYMQNRNINIGLNSSLKLSERNYQNTMSAKHVLSTTTESLNFSEEFNQFFQIVEGYRISLRDDIENPENFMIKINKNLIHKDRDIEDMKQNEYIEEFVIYDKENESNIIITELTGIHIYLADYLFKDIVSLRKKGKYDSDGFISIEMENIDPEEDLFFVILKNNEITKPLKELKSLIEKGKEIEGVNTISELIDKLNNLMKAGGIYVPSIHIEILARNIIRDKDDILKIPDYSKKNPEYVITSIHNSIMHSNSIINSLTFERIKQQLSDPSTYRKNGTCPLDNLFVLE